MSHDLKALEPLVDWVVAMAQGKMIAEGPFVEVVADAAVRTNQETGTQSDDERQMVSVGRALMASPQLLMVDEPTIFLAPKVCVVIAEALRRLNAETGLTILIAEQNVNFALTLASRIHVLEPGKIRLSGTADELAAEPAVAKAYFGH